MTNCVSAIMSCDTFCRTGRRRIRPHNQRRLGIITGFRLYFKLFAIRGFWVVLFYIGFDVIYTALGWEDGVAHWAHLGGFLFGVGIGVVLLFTRLVNCRGGDMASALLGRHAWALVGKPDPNRKAPLEYGW